MVFDIHSHILPAVDDGAGKISESIAILECLKRQGVDKVIATPHFYAAQCSIETYLERVLSAYEALLHAVSGKNLPEILLGFEVLYFKDISQNEQLARLCINSSRYLLLELPYEKLSERAIDDITSISLNQNITPILAHVERYVKYNGISVLERLIQDGEMEYQINAGFLARNGWRSKRKELSLTGTFRGFLGSDAHNMSTRAPEMDKAMRYLEKKLGRSALHALSSRNETLYARLTDTGQSAPARTSDRSYLIP